TAGNFPIPVGGYIDFTAYAMAVTNDYEVTVSITVDGTEFNLATYEFTSVAGGARRKAPLACAVIPSLPAGSYTVTLRFTSPVSAPSFSHTCHLALLAAGQPQK